MLSVVDSYSERFSRYFIEEQSADVVVLTSEYRFEFQRVLLRSVNDSVLISWNDVVECTVSYQQMKNQQMEKSICISAGEFFQAFVQSKFLTTTMDVSAGYQSNLRRKLK
ncbi:hypothetical protein F511_07541 [Dorcoceras hygrometricum]|uniref:Uncharacterized protein n=1 Tax=Dorcoceras hygrometricum TaxID=472368 RepID=A0A2Z7B3L7_9LAMI|nr:hypothetical protein F511_07541 [Dorcoceras hygrometricum]